MEAILAAASRVILAVKPWPVSLSLVAGISLATASPAQAAFFVRDYRAAGDGLLVFDDQTGLEWLELSVTRGQSMNGARASNPGFTVARQSDLVTLFANFGFTEIGLTSNGFGVSVPANRIPGLNFDSFFGNTSSHFGGQVRSTSAHFDNGANLTNLLEVQVRIPPAGFPGASTAFWNTQNGPELSVSPRSVMMFRASAVPEPGTWAVMVSGFGLVGGAIRKHNRNARRPSLA